MPSVAVSHLLVNPIISLWCFYSVSSSRIDHMLIIAGDYSLSMYEGTEQFYRPHLLIAHPEYNMTTHNADIMLIKVRDN